MIIRSTISNGQRWTLERRSFGHKVGRPTVNYVICDDLGPVFAWTAKAPTLHEWDRMFPRALAQLDAA